ncbi:endonuclease domain-containing protein [Streptomyces sp. 900105245]
MGYVLLGATVVRVETSKDGVGVREAEVRRAAAKLIAISVDRRDLVRIGRLGGVRKPKYAGPTLQYWRQRIMWELQELSNHHQTARGGGGQQSPLAGIDWAHVLVERHQDSSGRTWWLPRAVVRLLDAAAHAETRWLQATGSRQQTAPVIEPAVAHTGTPHGSLKVGTEDVSAPLRPYKGELQGHVYSVLTRKPGTSRKVAGWACAVCRTAASAVVDHCHEHGYVRAPVCQSCNTLERPDHLYSNDVRVAGRYQRLFEVPPRCEER